MTNQCQHGQLARVCQICEQAAEIADLRAQVAALEVDAGRWRMFLATRPPNTHAVIKDAIDAALAARKGG